MSTVAVRRLAVRTATRSQQVARLLAWRSPHSRPVVRRFSVSWHSPSTGAAPYAGRPDRDYDGLWSSTTFEDLQVHPSLVQALASQKIVRPTVVQAETFFPVAKGRDCILRAETGSGKTLAYLLPLVNRVYHLHDRARELAKKDPHAPNPMLNSRPWVVLLPTADLCAQVLAMLESIDADCLVSVQTLQRLFKWEGVRDGRFQEPIAKERTVVNSFHSGSAASSSSASESTGRAVVSPRIRWGAVDLVVTTPTKFCEDLALFKEENLFPACIVMDEADALFSGPSRGHVFDIFAALRPRMKIRPTDEPRKRLPEMIPTQFIFSAATMLHIGPHSVGNMIIERFCTAHTVETKNFHRLPTGISLDRVRWVTGSTDWDERIDQLVEVMSKTPAQRTLVFVNSLHNCHVLAKFLRNAEWPVVTYMKGPLGRMGPRFRDAKLFAEGGANVMVATDFGGRGLDWHEVDHVVNFQMPTSAVCWLHRVGRTGRIGKSGFVTSLVAAKDKPLADSIHQRLAAGKDLHGTFSRRRSLSRRRRESAEDGDDAEMVAEDGKYRFHGGLEFFEEDGTIRGDDAEQGSVIGFMEAVAGVEEPGVVGRRLRESLQSDSAPKRPTDNDNKLFGADHSLVELRSQLLASDSEDEFDPLAEKEGDSDDDEGDDPESIRSNQNESAEFSWDKLADSKDESAEFGPVPRRDLLNLQPQEDRHDARKYSRTNESGGHRRSKKRHVKDADRLAASRNYPFPDDDLL